MVETNLVAPARLAVASGTVAAHTASMHVVCLVAAKAFFRQLLRLRAGRMAGVAGQLFVFAVQRVFVLTEMVVFHRLPAIGLVAGGTVVAETASVRIFCRVAAVAGLRQLRLQVAVFVAGVAGNLAVLTIKAKTRFLQMVEAGVFPTHGAVTVLTGSPA